VLVNALGWPYESAQTEDCPCCDFSNKTNEIGYGNINNTCMGRTWICLIDGTIIPTERLKTLRVPFMYLEKCRMGPCLKIERD
jgi:hypothetical protein